MMRAVIPKGLMNKLILTLSLILFSNFSFAHKECLEEINTLYVGDDGYLWLGFKDGGMANIKDTDSDFKNILSVALAAHLGSRKVTMRYSSDSATCSEIRSDIQGVWIK